MPDTESPSDEPSRTPPILPRISDYWPDAPQRLGPPADHYELPGVDATRTGPALHTGPPPREGTAEDVDDRTKRDLKPVLFLAAVLLLTGGGVFAAVSYVRTSGDAASTSLPAPAEPAPVVVAPSAQAPNPPVSIGTSPPASTAPVTVPPSAAAPGAPTGGATEKPMIPDAATFELASGVTQLRVAVGDVTNGFFRVGVGEDSTITARAVVDDGTVRVTVAPNGRKNGSARLNVLLSDEVTWSFRMRGGVKEAGVDLSGAKVGGVALIAGASTVDLVLPTQRDAIGIVEKGGIGTWRIVTDGEVPVRATFEEGAGSVTLYDDTDTGLAKGETAKSGKGDDGIRLTSSGGVGALTVQAR
ncbi:hypothetical protein [Actinoplanes palleronii]|uniref:hypothetical protein n=1 Tax=Actinoplanes palleronii TaxID=113570 RepID=UPI001942EF86|nr:hypothetical protein [Actinoplanes palleronii]